MEENEQEEILDAMQRGDISIIVDVVHKWGLEIKCYGEDNGTLLHEAAKEGQKEFISYLLNAGADARSLNGKGETPFHVAAKAGKHGICKAFALKFGFDLVNAPCQNESGQTALHLACANSHYKCLEVLLDELDANPLVGANLFGRQNVTPIHQAVHGELSLSLFVLATWKDGILLNAPDGDGNTAFHLAVSISQISAIRLLVEKCDQDVEAECLTTKRTALDLAVISNDIEVVEVLVDLEADVNKSAAKKFNRKRPLHTAIEARHSKMVKLLLNNGANVKLVDGSGNNPFHYAIKRKNIECAKVLFKGNPALIEIANAEGQTPLLVAVSEHGDIDTIDFLNNKCRANIHAIDRLGISVFTLACLRKNFTTAEHLAKVSKGKVVNAENGDGSPPLHYFISVKRSLKTIKFILDHGGAVNQYGSISGRTALHLVAANDDIEIAKELLNRGADIKAVSKGKDDANCTPESLAVQARGKKVMDLLFQYQLKKQTNKGNVTELVDTLLHDTVELGDQNDVVKFLGQKVDLKKVLNHHGFMGRTKLHVACMENRANNVESFLNAGAKMEAVSSIQDFNRTALHFAILFGSVDCFDLLIKKGADLNRKDSNGNTPLHIAAFTGNLTIVTKLISFGVDIGQRGFNGKTAIHDACHWICEENSTESEEFGYIAKDGSFYQKKIAMAMNEITVRPTNEVGGQVYLPKEVYAEKTEIVKLLIKEAPALGSVRDNDGNRSVHIAAMTGHMEILRFFVEWNRTVFLENRGSLSWTPLHFASNNIQHSSAKYLLKNAKANPNTKSDAHSDSGRTPLHCLLMRGSVTKSIVTSIQILIQNGADLESKDFYGDRPIHYAIVASHRDSSWLSIVSMLIESGADFEALGKQGWTIFEKAIANPYDNTRPVDYLFRLGLILKDYSKAIELAKRLENDNIADYLENMFQNIKLKNERADRLKGLPK